MKKSLIFIFFTLFAFTLHAQCNILGEGNLLPNTESSFSVDTEIAQCPQCFQWNYVGNNISIVSDKRLNKITVKTEKTGIGYLTLTILTPNGIINCIKEVTVNKNTSGFPVLSDSLIITKSIDINPIENTTTDCDIKVDNFKEIKAAEQITAFFPNEINSNFKYKWLVQYFDGSTMSSTEAVPQFPYSAENEIERVNVTISSGRCIKKFTKTYEKNYWKFFK